MRRAPRAWRALAVAVLGTAVLAGCVTLPDHSSVNAGQNIGLRDCSNHIRYVPSGPRPGGSKDDIIQGYLNAMLAQPQSAALVRSFLTPDASTTWDPSQLLLVYENPVLADNVDGSVQLTSQVLGSLDQRGSWVSATSSDDSLDTPLTLERVDGEWRISNPPPGTLIDTDTFTRYYHQYSLYFFNPATTVLTPDPVYVLVGSPSHTASALVSNLLLGPTASMGGVASSEVPPTTLLDPRVTVTASGLAQMPMTSQVSSLSPTELNLFAAQLAWTLRQQCTGVTRARITVAGRPLAVPRLGPDFPVLSSFPTYDPSGFPANANLYALLDGRLVGVATNGASNPVAPVQGPIGTSAKPAEQVAVDVSATHAALVVGDRTQVEVGSIAAGETGPNAFWLRGAVSLLKPSWDIEGLLWVVDRTAAGAVVRVLTSTGTKVVDAPGIAGQDVRAFAVSRDGMRFAAVIGRGAASRLVIAMVRRSTAALTDVSLTSAEVIGNAGFPLVNLSKIAWYSPTVVTVLAQAAGSEPQPYQMAIDGSRVLQTTGFLPVRPVSLAAGADAGIAPVIGTVDGRLYIRMPNQQWPPIATKGPVKLLVPTYPG